MVDISLVLFYSVASLSVRLTVVREREIVRNDSTVNAFSFHASLSFYSKSFDKQRNYRISIIFCPYVTVVRHVTRIFNQQTGKEKNDSKLSSDIPTCCPYSSSFQTWSFFLCAFSHKQNWSNSQSPASALCPAGLLIFRLSASCNDTQREREKHPMSSCHQYTIVCAHAWIPK